MDMNPFQEAVDHLIGCRIVTSSLGLLNMNPRRCQDD